MATDSPFVNRPSHWELERVYTEEQDIPIGDERGYIKVDAEVPMAGDKRLPRHGNRYYPTLIEVDLPKHVTLHSDTARELGQKLIAAADAADAIDTPDGCEVCHTWKPCLCPTIESEAPDA